MEIMQLVIKIMFKQRIFACQIAIEAQCDKIITSKNLLSISKRTTVSATITDLTLIITVTITLTKITV
jgi:hypothetical protein